jgi:hypothetical protein
VSKKFQKPDTCSDPPFAQHDKAPIVIQACPDCYAKNQAQPNLGGHAKICQP